METEGGTDAVDRDEPLTFRPAVAVDGDGMRQVAQAAYQQYEARIGREPAPMVADYARIATSGTAWVVERHGCVVGFLVLEPHADHLLLENVAVDPALQGAGVGGLLLALAEDRARSLGLPEVRLFTNAAMTENLAYYLRRGYRQTHRAEQDGYQRVFLTKPLVGDAPA